MVMLEPNATLPSRDHNGVYQFADLSPTHLLRTFKWAFGQTQPSHLGCRGHQPLSRGGNT